MGSAGLCPPAGSAAHQHASTWSASPGASGPDGIHYDVKRNLWAQLGGLGGIVDTNPLGLILGFVPIPNGDPSTTNFAFGGPDNQ